MDAVENGQAFTVTRDGHRIGELIPLRRRRRFVPGQEFAAMSRSRCQRSTSTPFRADQEAAADHGLTSPYAADRPVRQPLPPGPAAPVTGNARHQHPDPPAVGRTPSELAGRDGNQRGHARRAVGRPAPGAARRSSKPTTTSMRNALRRLDVLQRAEHEFDPIPFDSEAARAYGRVTAAVIGAGRKPAAQNRRPDDRFDRESRPVCRCTRQTPMTSRGLMTCWWWSRSRVLRCTGSAAAADHAAHGGGVVRREIPGATKTCRKTSCPVGPLTS